MSDLAERLEALIEQNSRDLPTTFPATDEEVKARYLELLAEGHTPPQAAAQCGKTGRYMRSFRSEKSERYDEDFASRYEKIMAPDGEHREALVQNARAALIEAAKSGNVRAIEKILMAYDPDFQFLRPAQFQGDFNIETLVQIMPGIPTPLLQQIREALAIDAARELPDIEAA